MQPVLRLKMVLRVLPLMAFVASMPASWAVTNFSPGDLSSVTNDTVNSLLKTIAVGGAHRAYQSASGMGITGFDLGLEVTAISLPQEFKTALSVATGQATTSIPTLVPMPKLNFHKGLPFGVNLGFSYSSYQSLFKSVGGDVSWAFLNLPALPAVAARVSGNYTKLWFIGTHAYTFDVVASKNLIFIEPYAGLGFISWSGDLNVPLSGPGGLSANVQAHTSGSTGHFFFGMPIKLLLLRITPEMDFGFSGVSTYGVKVSLGF